MRNYSQKSCNKKVALGQWGYPFLKVRLQLKVYCQHRLTRFQKNAHFSKGLRFCSPNAHFLPDLCCQGAI